jgi:hypothetical protein
MQRGDTMFNKFAGIGTIALAFATSVAIASAQTDGPQPSRNDPPPSAPNQGSKDPVPPATDPSLPTRGGKQEPTSKVEGTEANLSILHNGVLTVAGAPQDSHTAPAKFSKRTDEADKLPIAAYTLRHLSGQQRDQLYSALHTPMALSGEQLGSLSEVGAEVPTNALKGLKPLPEQLLSQFPELKSLVFAGVGDKIVLVDPVQHRVVALVNP